MALLRDRRAVILVGMAVALAAGLGIAAVMLARGGGPTAAPPASQGGLIVQTGRDDDIKLDERRPLRCFVNGKLIGELTLSDCARRNGVASGALDVGLDPSGALAAANGVSSQITPLPPPSAPTASSDAAVADDTDGTESPAAASAMPATGRVAGCWLYADAGWTRVPEDLALGACIRTLYPDRCQRVGPPSYGRWADRTLRLLDGRIEISPDNRNFRVLLERGAGCGAAPE